MSSVFPVGELATLPSKAVDIEKTMLTAAIISTGEESARLLKNLPFEILFILIPQVS
ncbi:hypothetical protein cbdbB19 [Dehalococcoides mccartyi CBDB1]|uniref:Uncharacterized protein n=1 Tax=Dehalococcoides mccartyi (strain CBDB1) TaxID=255470 RepID=A0A916KMF3_DEHMC|nr:hypothetical protein cbdbB19 [Dehalococcoides mccartyi CBDB1]